MEETAVYLKILGTTACKWGPGCFSQKLALSSTGSYLGVEQGAKWGCTVSHPVLCKEPHGFQDPPLPSSSPVGPETAAGGPRACVGLRECGGRRRRTVPESTGASIPRQQAPPSSHRPRLFARWAGKEPSSSSPAWRPAPWAPGRMWSLVA